jgi:hypothetical protein
MPEKTSIETKERIAKCKKTFCKKYVKKEQEKTKLFTNTFLTSFQKSVKIPPESQKQFSSQMNIIKKELGKKIKNDDISKKLLKSCMKKHCNPGCKGTIYQNGELKMNDLKQKLSNKEINLIKEIRKGLFNGKKTILKDNFYIGLKKSKNKLKKNGAISGCKMVNK